MFFGCFFTFYVLILILCLIVSSPNPCLLRTSKSDLIWKQDLCDVCNYNQVTVVQGGPSSNDWCSYKKTKQRHRQTDTIRENTCDNGGRHWSDGSVSQGMPRIAGHYQELGRNKEGSAPRNLEKASPCQYLNFRSRASRPICEYISIGLNLSVCGNFLWQP